MERELWNAECEIWRIDTGLRNMERVDYGLWDIESGLWMWNSQYGGAERGIRIMEHGLWTGI
eukprot:11158092-Lingulodinium_polyedra.AAC.1